METAFVLMFYLWTATVNAGGHVSMAEFSSRERCEAAGAAAAAKFGGTASKPYWLCVPK